MCVFFHKNAGFVKPNILYCHVELLGLILFHVSLPFSFLLCFIMWLEQYTPSRIITISLKHKEEIL